MLLVLEGNDDNNSFIVDYATSVTRLGKKIPEEIHNRLICLGMTCEDDWEIKQYFESVKDLEDNRKLELVKHLTFEELEGIIKKFNKIGVESL